MTNDRIYIHELIDIRGHHRGDYMHHMTANWSPNAQEDRGQLCFGVWGVVGSTGAWPRVCNIWEERGWAGLARSLDGELTGPDLQDPKLKKWWAKANEFRSGGFDRILEPAPWMPTIDDHMTAGTRGEAFAHELVTVEPGAAADLLEEARAAAVPAYERHGWELIGAFTTALGNDDEALLLWSMPSFGAWARAEQAARDDEALRTWRERARTLSRRWQRILLANAPLCPFRTGRQPRRDDRTGWEE